MQMNGCGVSSNVHKQIKLSCDVVSNNGRGLKNIASVIESE